MLQAGAARVPDVEAEDAVNEQSIWRLGADLARLRIGTVTLYRVGPGDPFTHRQTARKLRVAARRWSQSRPCPGARGYRQRFVRNRRRRA